MLDSRGLADRFQILNFGFGLRFAARAEDIAETEWVGGSYLQTCDYQQALRGEPDIVFIMLGTNDILYFNHTDEDKERMTRGLVDIFNGFQALPNKPEIFLLMPPPIFDEPLHDH